ncbi:MAG: cyclase [Chlorobiaceae bacterium]|nr:cyclase [Chlorobiaceae bacterium]
MILVTIITSLLYCASTKLSASTILPDTLSTEKARLLNGEIIVKLTSLDNGVTGVFGKIYIKARPEIVWAVLTDYNNHKHYIPKITDSGLISGNGNEQVIFQSGQTTILIFRKRVYIKVKTHGEYLKQLDFQQIAGDFKVYHGRWILDESPQGKGTFLTYECEVKPDFFAPAFVVRFVQRHDFPMVLSAMKSRAESMAVSVLK